MSYIALSLLTSIVCMFALIYVVARFIGASKVGLWHAAVNGYLRGDCFFKDWVKNNNIYYWSFLFLVTLIITALMMLVSFSDNKILNRPEIAVIVAPFLWYSLFKCIRWYQRKTEELLV